MINTASAHEVTAACAVSVVGAMLVIGATAATSEDDVVDAAALAVLAVVAATIGATLATLGAILAYVATPVATPDA
jgi:ATP sulfurylase